MAIFTKKQGDEIRRKATQPHRYDFAVVVHPEIYKELKKLGLLKSWKKLKGK